jgi:PmbA protein
MKINSGFAEELVSEALRSGADQAEIFMRSSKKLSVEIKGGKPDSLISSLSYGYGLRVIRDNRPGFSYSTDLTDRQNVINQALEAARFADQDNFLGFPEPSESPEVEICDPAIMELKEDTAVSLVTLLEKTTLKTDKRVTKVRKASGSFTSSETFLANSNDIAIRYLSTSCSAQVTAVADNGNESQTGWDFSGSRFLKNVSFEKTGRTAAERSVRLLGARTVPGARISVILDNSVAIDFLGVLASSFSSEALQKGKSLLKDKLGKEIVSPLINITDNGLLPGALGTKPADDEGVPVREKVLVRKGVLQGYLYNSYTARKGNTSSTGNAVRGGFSSAPSVGITNLCIEPVEGQKKAGLKELFRSLGKGLYIVDAMGVHTANPVSGDFSLGVTGLWIEGGEVCFPVKEAVISGNILDLFHKIVGTGDDLVFYGSLGAPSLMISDVDLSS